MCSALCDECARRGLRRHASKTQFETLLRLCASGVRVAVSLATVQSSSVSSRGRAEQQGAVRPHALCPHASDPAERRAASTVARHVPSVQAPPLSTPRCAVHRRRTNRRVPLHLSRFDRAYRASLVGSLRSLQSQSRQRQRRTAHQQHLRRQTTHASETRVHSAMPNGDRMHCEARPQTSETPGTAQRCQLSRRTRGERTATIENSG